MLKMNTMQLTIRLRATWRYRGHGLPLPAPFRCQPSGGGRGVTPRFHSSGAGEQKGQQRAQEEGEAKAEEEHRAQKPQAGDPVLFGAAGSAAVFGVLRFLMRRGVTLAPGLQFLPAVPLLLGVVEDIRRGGWGLLWLAVPFTGASVLGLNSFREKQRIQNLLNEATTELKAAYPDLPDPALQAFREAKATEFETNRLVAEAEWPAAATEAPEGHWRFELRARRSFGWEGWSLSSLQLSQAPGSGLSLPGAVPPAQTRHWDKPHLNWKVVWERA